MIAKLLGALGGSTTPRQARCEAAARGRRRRHHRRGRAAAARRCRSSIVLVPPAEPRTKPKALNFGLTLATRRVRHDLRRRGPARPAAAAPRGRRIRPAARRLGCLQAQLAYYNTDQNLLTRWFTIEYLLWFPLSPARAGGVRHAGAARRHVEPHPRATSLDEIGAWDPYNVTEDADLGIRLHRVRLPLGGARLGHATRRPTATTSTGSSSGRVGTRATCRRGWCTCATRAPCRRARLARLHPVQPVRRRHAAARVAQPVLLGDDARCGSSATSRSSRTLFPTAIYYPALFCFVFGNVMIGTSSSCGARLGQPSLVLGRLAVRSTG